MAKSKDPNDFMRKVVRVRRRLPGVVNRAQEKTAEWLETMGKQTTGFMDRTGSLRSTIKGGVVTKAKPGMLRADAFLTAGDENVSYPDPETGELVKTSDYAAAVELGGINPRSRSGMNPPHPYIQPTVDLAVSLDIVSKNLKAELLKAFL